MESMKQYKINLEKKKLIDLLQMKYSCCGSDKYSDWFQVTTIKKFLKFILLSAFFPKADRLELR